MAVTSTSTFGEELDAHIVARLRERYPYMRIKAVRSIAQESGTRVQERIQAEEPLMQTSEDNISFMSLSAELRNRIYELVLIPQKDDEGGIDGTTDIYVGSHTTGGYQCQLEQATDGDGDCYRRGFDAFAELKTWLRQVGKAQAALVQDLGVHVRDAAVHTCSRNAILPELESGKYGLATSAVITWECKYYDNPEIME
ncbi:hypothetical protein LTR36_000785 [Oleoguttula mirabilis]|uniref:Uncharacterized protein n=1 Tax=Oleoguttula mirabilis TaxID=1507867 RepID=A0AAV9J3Q6_9PEZI|nr:hypothetical protein LTR36_000785 [Oleoguttula mirabilis]